MRPGYPESLIEDVCRMSTIEQGGTILEIGCGTGQATIPFAQRGFPMLCLDIGANMITIARKKFHRWPQVVFKTVSFEEWTAEKEAFDLVISGTAFHWVREDIRYQKVATVLKATGSLAIFSNLYPDPDTHFFRALQEVYRESVPEWSIPQGTPVYQSNYNDNIRRREEEINATGLFDTAVVRRYPWVATYSATEYVKLLDTYSDHRRLNDTTKRRLFDRIVDLINESGGTMTKPYLAVLWFARKQYKDSHRPHH